MNIKEWQEKVYKIAVSKGWYDKDVHQATDIERHMLIVSEVAEATEEARARKEPVYIENGKPEGEAVELADAAIRIFDYFEHKGWNLEEVMKLKSDYNETRPYRHGGKLV